jgi:hypothetical protein
MTTNTDNTDTNLPTQDNTPINSDDEEEQKSQQDLDKDIIYHVNPEGVINVNPDLAGKVEQAYIYCKACNKWQKLTTQNSIQLPFGEFSFQKQYYTGNYYCWTTECNNKNFNVSPIGKG